MFKVWTYNIESPYVYWLNVPSVVNQESLRFFEEEQAFFKQSIKNFSSQVTQMMTAVTSLPPEEANDLLRGIIAEVKERQDIPEPGRILLLLYGPEVDDPTLLQAIEDCGANMVIDDGCVGTRFFWHDVGRTEYPLDGLRNRYLGKVMCPRTIRGKREGWSTR